MEHDQFAGKLKTLMVARVLVATTILVSYYFFQSFYTVETSPLKWLIVLIIVTYILTIFYSLLISRLHNLMGFAYLQHIGDALIITSVLYITGGVTSPFSILYTASIFSASIILYMRGALLMASFSSIFYGLLITLQLYGIIHPLGYYDLAEVEEKTLYQLVINIVGFYVLGLLSGFLAEKVRKIDDELETNKLYLARLQELHDNVIRSISVGLIISDKKGNAITVNDAAINLLGITRSSLQEGNIADFLHYPAVKEVLAGLEKNALPLSRMESTIKSSAGNEIMLEMKFSFWRSHEGIVNGLVILLQDITAEKELERSVKLHEKLAAIGELAAGLAHEIRNPLASMNGSVQLLRTDSVPNPDQRERLFSIIQREANRLNNIVTEFLNYAAPVSPTFREVNIKSFLEDFIELLKRDERFGNEIHIRLNVSEGNRYPIDEQRIIQLLWNVSLNSIESIRQAKRSQGVVEWTVKQKGKALFMSFQDNGTGISDDVNKSLFTPFYTTKDNGTGLGLALIHTIVKEHYGEIVVNRNIEEGVEFRVTLNSLLQMD